MPEPYASFPPSFKFGCATAAYQVEGAAQTDGRGPSIWDTFSRQPGRVMFNHNGDVAVDQYHRYKEDVQLMKWLDLKMYRFSISWSRVLPTGRGTINEAGIGYYERLTDELLSVGVEPWVTLFHWDLPQALQDDFGGWQSAETSRYFAEYAAVVSQRLSDRVSQFFTVNEFFCFTDKGYGMGEVFDAFAPGIKLPAAGLNQVRHHALLGHGLATQALRHNAKSKIKVGLAENAQICCPIIETPENVQAARKAFRELNGAFLTPVLEGAYPQTYLDSEGADAPRFTDDEMRIIGSPLDFVGVNMYAPILIRASEKNPAGYETVPLASSHPKFIFDWLRFGPEIAYWGPRFLKEIWNVDEVYITENGCAGDDQQTYTGEILDTDRVLYLRQHFISAARAVAEGWPLKGYFVWSLLDNFEWAHGFLRRFGLFYVNFATLARTPKLSAEFVRETIKRRAIA